MKALTSATPELFAQFQAFGILSSLTSALEAVYAWLTGPTVRDMIDNFIDSE